MKYIIYDELNEIDNSDLIDFYTNRPIMLFATLNTWCGSSYCLVNVTDEEKNKDWTLKDFIVRSLLRNSSSELTVSIDTDTFDICVKEAHHDATNTYIYRALKKRCSAEALVNKFYKTKNISELYDTYMSKTQPIEGLQQIIDTLNTLK